ncbi:MAG: mechanosensitive ion channel [Holophagaceae bacterium]
MGAFTPEERAAAITERLAQLERTPFGAVPVIQVTDDGTSSIGSAGDYILFTVTEEDARAASTDRVRLAQSWASQVHGALTRDHLPNRLRAFGVNVLWILLLSLATWAALWLFNRLFRRLHHGASDLLTRKMGGLRIQNLELLSADQVSYWLLKLLGLARALFLLVAAYLYLSTLFSFFPATRGLASRLLDLAITPVVSISQSIVAYIPNLFFLAIIGLVTWFTLKVTRLLFEGIQGGKLVFGSFHSEWADPTQKLVRILILAFALVLAFPYLPGSGSEAFKGVSLFLGVLFSLGSSGAVTNLVAGVLLTYMRPFKNGDRVQIGDTVGDVVERTALVTRILTIKNVEVSIPNSTVLATQVQNFSARAKQEGLILHTTVTIGYDTPWKTVHGLLIDAALSTEGILRDPKPFVFQTSLDDFYVSYQVNAYTDQANQMAAIYAALHANIQDKFNEGGVEIMSPHYRMARDGNQTTIPVNYLPQGYRAPGFRIQPLPPEE